MTTNNETVKKQGRSKTAEDRAILVAFRISEDWHDRLAVVAQSEDRVLNNMALRLIKQGIEEWEKGRQ